MKIGLCLSYKGTNYGMILQAYATQQVLHNLDMKQRLLITVEMGIEECVLRHGLIFFFINKKIKKYVEKKSQNL